MKARCNGEFRVPGANLEYNVPGAMGSIKVQGAIGTRSEYKESQGSTTWKY